MTAAKNERAGSVKGVEERDALIAGCLRNERRDDKERRKQAKGGGTAPP